MNVKPYPLSWPHWIDRTPSSDRDRARFGSRSGESRQLKPLTVAQGVIRAMAELKAIGVGDWDVVISTNIATRADGLPYSRAKEPGDPGVAVWFRLDGEERCMPCDRWDRVADNLAAIAGHISATRAIERYGVQSVKQAFSAFAALPDHSASVWSMVLQVSPSSDRSTVEAAYRRLRSQFHPDRPGGDRDAFNGVQRAWEQYLAGAKS